MRNYSAPVSNKSAMIREVLKTGVKDIHQIQALVKAEFGADVSYPLVYQAKNNFEGKRKRHVRGDIVECYHKRKMQTFQVVEVIDKNNFRAIPFPLNMNCSMANVFNFSYKGE